MIVSVKNVVKKYGKVKALDGLDFETTDKEFFVLLGPSGAGKTTTLKVIAGLEDIDEGEVFLDGKPMAEVPPNQRPVGMTFESYALYPHFTVFENLANPLRAPGRNFSEEEIKTRVGKVATMLKIDQLLDRHPGELSGGQKQRTSLGRTMVRQPSVYLLDEPLTHLDAKIRFDLRLEFHRLEELQNSTTIYVTHDYVEALSLGHRIGIVNEGKIVQVGTPKQIYYEPVDIFVARLVGEPPINLLEAQIESEGGVGVVRIPKAGIKIPLPEQLMTTLEQAGASRELTIGVRPRDIDINLNGQASMGQGQFDVMEPYGSLGRLSVKAKDIFLELLVDREASFPQDVTLGLNMRVDGLLFFDTDSKKNLLL